ncbi:hypothetical protein SAMN06265365_11926 [Tistlia consotensis]|uniref:Uncharacterized protein n=1 Tax=Tistlia consotensis USBA 355 TaxID=560819 RepID=A0A1Y6CBW8_9PROT|nr:hypothetical protein [Tistlia consotensis]SMF55171.1 hypothetical protein SAMN05428998_12026 [Tistlia consotensis USBA 355]SNR87832.1 hypothetical protein SAMN06265365_11926 [Tistlia consotensis]
MIGLPTPSDRPTALDRPAPAARRWPRWLRRGPMEGLATALIAFGIFMLMQPVSLALYGHSFAVILTGTLAFVVVSHFPE